MKHSVLTLAALAVSLSSLPAQAIEPMSPQQIIDLGKPAVGFSYWWGHGRFNAGDSAGSCSGSCPSCTHGGQNGGDCSGFVAKAWQVPGPIDMGKDAHPYSTYNFDNESTHWSDVDKGSAAKSDAFVYNSGGAGHIFLYESGDPWGYVNAYECKGCSYGCTFGSRSADAKYKAIRRNSLTGDCQAHCEGSKIFGADCGQGDCAAYGATCADDALGVRCVFSACPPTGEVTVCLDDKTLGTCKDGQITSGDCSAFAAYCSTAGGQPAHCASAFCVGSPQDVPQEHDICFLDGKRYHCDAAGGVAESPCPGGSQCSTYPDVHCQANLGCPPSGKGAKICLDDRVIGECIEGAATNPTSCAELDSYCSTALGGEPRCIHTACVAGPSDAPTDRTVCTSDGQLAHCKADGTVDLSACPDGTACSDGACAATDPQGGAGQQGQAGQTGQTGKGGSQGSTAGSDAGGHSSGAAGKGASGKGGAAGKGSAGKGGQKASVLSFGEESESSGCSTTPRPARGLGAALALAALALVRRRRR